MFRYILLMVLLAVCYPSSAVPVEEDSTVTYELLMKSVSGNLEDKASLDQIQQAYELAVKNEDDRNICRAVLLMNEFYYLHGEVGRMRACRDKIDPKHSDLYADYYFRIWYWIPNFYIQHRLYGKAMAEVRNFQDKASELKSSVGVGLTLKLMGDLLLAQNKRESALDITLQSYNYLKDHKVPDKVISAALMGRILYQLDKYNEALKWFELALADGYERNIMMQSYSYMAIIYLKTDRMARAHDCLDKVDSLNRLHSMYFCVKNEYRMARSLDYLLHHGDLRKAVACADSIDEGYMRTVTLENVYESGGNDQLALYFLKKQMAIRDSLSETEEAGLLAKYQTFFRTEQLTKQTEELMQEKNVIQRDFRRNSYAFIASILFLLLMFSVSVIYANRIQKKELRNERNMADMARMQAECAQQKAECAQQKAEGEQKRAEAALAVAEEAKAVAEKAQQKAERADALKSLFLQNMSHEIRTPLNAIVGFNDLLNGDGAVELSPEEKSEFTRLIRTNADVLLALVNDILDLSKLESGTYKINLSMVEANELCRTCMSNVSSKVNEGVQLKFESDTEELALTTDALRVQQVITNFLTNACKYTESGSITLNCRLIGDKVRFTVSDTGCGISPEKAGEVFKRFEKLNSFKQGTGLGLSICQLIAKLLHGTVALDTSYTGGASFYFEMPVDCSAAAAENASEA